MVNQDLIKTTNDQVCRVCFVYINWMLYWSFI